MARDSRKSLCTGVHTIHVQQKQPSSNEKRFAKLLANADKLLVTRSYLYRETGPQLSIARKADSAAKRRAILDSKYSPFRGQQ
ncbi:hypothetical protein CCR75_004564 [Bremia lactucae]|uniref:Uncharacterized protein n=1 Tax=Bremia lactucae TaxID=4779 RepID=A0A976IIL6_BRELC|nr:hypothetical protein CCR75_004564 [Bremia lactucae]